MKYCKIVAIRKEANASGGETWILTHECGKIEGRVARRRGDGYTHPAPTRVKCDNAK